MFTSESFYSTERENHVDNSLSRTMKSQGRGVDDGETQGLSVCVSESFLWTLTKQETIRY